MVTLGAQSHIGAVSNMCFILYLKNLFLQHRERSELRLHFGQKFIKMPKMAYFACFGKPEGCSQTVLPDNFSRTKLLKNAKN